MKYLLCGSYICICIFLRSVISGQVEQILVSVKLICPAMFLVTWGSLGLQTQIIYYVSINLGQSRETNFSRRQYV